MKIKTSVFPSPNKKKCNAANKGQTCVTTEYRNYLTSEEFAKLVSIDVSDDPALDEFQHLFMEQVFCSAQDGDMVSPDELDGYHHSIAELMVRAGIVSGSKPNASFLTELGFRTSAKIIGEFHFVDSEPSYTIC